MCAGGTHNHSGKKGRKSWVTPTEQMLYTFSQIGCVRMCAYVCASAYLHLYRLNVHIKCIIKNAFPQHFYVPTHLCVHLSNLKHE